MPKKSKIWRHFENVGKNEAQCTICLRKVRTSGNTSNLFAHLKTVHNRQFHDIQSEGNPIQMPDGETTSVSAMINRISSYSCE